VYVINRCFYFTTAVALVTQLYWVDCGRVLYCWFVLFPSGDLWFVLFPSLEERVLYLSPVCELWKSNIFQLYWWNCLLILLFCVIVIWQVLFCLLILQVFVYWSNWFVILAVCLCVCQLHTVHNFKLIVIKLFQVGEVVSTETPLDFEVKGHLEVKFQISSFFIRLTWNLKKICTLHHRIGKPTLVEVKRSKVKSRSNF